MGAYLTIKKNDMWVVYWGNADEMYSVWDDYEQYTGADWAELDAAEVRYVLGKVEQDEYKRKAWVKREEDTYKDLLASHAALEDIQKQKCELANAQDYLDELQPIKAQLEMLERMVDQSGKDDKWYYQLG